MLITPINLGITYTARTRHGVATHGTLACASPQAAMDLLREMGLGEIELSSSSHSPPAAAEDPALALPGLSSLELLADDQPTHRRARALRQITQAINNGQPLIEAWHRQRKSFPRRDRIFLDIAAANGRLPAALGSMPPFDLMRQRYDYQLRSAFVIPMVAWIIACAIFLAWFMVGVGQFEKIFEDFNTDLPALTLELMNLGRWLSGTLYPHQAVPGLVWLIPAMASVLATAGLLWWLLRWSGPTFLDGILFRIPKLGLALRAIRNAAFGQSVALGVAAGLGLPRAIVLACRAQGSRSLRRDGRRVINAMRNESPNLIPILIGPDYCVLSSATVATLQCGHSDTAAGLAQLAAIQRQQTQSALATIGPVVAFMLLSTILSFSGLVVLALFLPLFSLIIHLT